MDRGYGISVWAANATVVAPYTIAVGAAGYFTHAFNGLDKRNPRSNSTENFRSRGCIPDAMVIRRDLMDTAIANGTGLGHVLHMFLVETSTAAGFRHPMIGTESAKYGWGAEGTRLAITPTVVSPNAACHPPVSSWPAPLSSMVATLATTQDQEPP